ncbi:hypothetical protein KBX06_24795 [Micromonospora sp. C31]|uniref:hypothetical protein n=1 Tax=Micromonospora sp. C31 TaxID=2824876 RepID=UPI001B35CEB6|nr:hypothetical protein [Micromonospora sp. C31]MBQ1076351.1 hypothetical protein [Micromonospora sp. C31]
MTWRETYWHDAASDPAYFTAVEFATVLDGDYGTRLFGRWVAERYPYSHELVRAVEYLLVTNAYAEDVTETLDILHLRLPRPWDDPAMLTALERTTTRFPHVPTQVRDDHDANVLADALSADIDTFRLWREEIQQAAVALLRDGGVMDTFLDDCALLAGEAKEHQAVQALEKGKERVDGPLHIPSHNQGHHGHEESDATAYVRSDEGTVTVVRKPGVSFSEPAEVAARRYPWLSYPFRLGVAFTLNPEANSHLPETFSWDEAQVHLGRWGVDLDELVERIEQAMGNRFARMYRDERMVVSVIGESVDVTVTIDSALNAHNTGILATLDSDGAYTHYVQFKDLVMFYVDENDMYTPIYNVLKTFGDLWVGGDAESYVVRHGKGRKAYFTVTSVKPSHQASLVAVVRRCSDGMTVKVLS